MTSCQQFLVKSLQQVCYRLEMEAGQLDTGEDFQDVEMKPAGLGGESIKLFVGQIPRTWEDPEVRAIFEPFGAIQDLSILKDRATGSHKGCAFITFVSRQSAVEAQKSLHEKKTLPGMNHPMQVKPATNEPKLSTMGDTGRPMDRRLFVGMLCRNYTEDEVRAMFMPYGTVEDVSILRNAEGRSKGAAFVRMSTKAEALQAITALHQSQTMRGCSAPLVVKVADTERDKNAKRMQNTLASMGVNGMGHIGLQAAAYYQLLQLQAAQSGAPSVNNSFGLDLALLNQQQSPTGPPGSGFHVPQVGGAGALGNLSSAMLSASNSSGAQPLGGKSLGMVGSESLMSAYLGMQPGTPQQQQFASFQQIPNTSAAQSFIFSKQQKIPVYNKQKEGPDGCNLFIYHLPNDVTDPDLHQMFAPFGSVVSAKVYIDKVTNLSKCFGFVSFDNAVSASSAIQAMNGFQMGTKRLKVQLKKPKEMNRPY